MARRKECLERVNQQLRMLYGPLYVQNIAGREAWRAFRSEVRPRKPFFNSDPPPSADELLAWRLWMTTVFQPIHDEMVNIISTNADLFDDDDLPMPIQLFLGHVAAYKVVFKLWQTNDFSKHTSVMAYPREELDTYLETEYQKLKARQRRLLGSGA